ncbi:MAG: homoaconitase [Candidatus Eisenbacteria bacterium]
MAQNRIEKIAQRHAVGLARGTEIKAGDFVSVRPRHCMTHDNTGAVIPKWRSMGATRIFDPTQPVIPIDHDVQNETPENLKKYAAIETFAREHGLAFFPAKSGIGHQIMVEEGFVLPGSFVVGSDSHSNLYGAVGALGTPVVRTDAAAIWATGETWWQVPDVVRVKLEGALQPGVTGKDVIIALIGYFKDDEVLNCAIEFEGNGLLALSMDQRMTIANMTTEWGALVGLIPYDQVTRDYLLSRAEKMKRRGDASPRLSAEILAAAEAENPTPDPGCYYAKEFTFDLAAVTPHVAGPNEVKLITPLSVIEPKRVKIDKAYLLSCVNSRLEDIADAASVLRGKKVASGVSMYLAAASRTIEEEAKAAGHWQALLDAGAIPLPPGCGPCIGLGTGVLENGEVAISATNRNFKGRMGSAQSFAYLASPAVVAASAAAGYIAAPTAPASSGLRGEVRVAPAPPVATTAVSIREGFPARVVGRVLWCDKDNMNTDGIYGKEFTYKDNLPREEMAQAAMLNYDPHFQEIAREGDILASGWNFGTGSSREQAATALLYRGIALVIAGSYSQTYKRNAFNNGYIVLECPELIADLRAAHAGGAPTVATDWTASVDFGASTIEAGGKSYRFFPLREVAQELVALGGFENVLREKIRNLKPA